MSYSLKSVCRQILGVIAMGLILGLSSIAAAGTFVESFSTNPAGRGWQTVGDVSLFNWNASAGNLKVAWDSGKTNSYFRRPLGTILDKYDDFTLGFDLFIEDIAIGVRPGKAFTFELAVGFHNSINATNGNFLRGVARQSPNLVEFNYFPDSGYGATIWPAFIATNGVMFFDSVNPDRSYTLLDLPAGVWMKVSLDYRGSNQTLHTSITANGKSIGTINPVQLAANFGNYRVDMFSISSYSDQNAGGSLMAHGIIDNITVTVPESPLINISPSALAQSGKIEFLSKTNWMYQVEQTSDFQTWSPVAPALPGNASLLDFPTDITSMPAAYYRVKLFKP